MRWKYSHNQAVAEFIAEIGERVFARAANVDGRVRNECVCVRVVRPEFVASNARIGGQIEYVHGVGANILRCIANANGATVKNP